MKLRRYLLIGLLCFGVMAGNLMAAEKDQQEAFELGDIVVTGEKADVSDVGISDTITLSRSRPPTARQWPMR